MSRIICIEITPDFSGKIESDILDLVEKVEQYQPIWQSIEWQKMLLRSRYSTKSFFIGSYEEDVLVSYIILEKRSVGFGFFWFFGIGGPVTREVPQKDFFHEIQNCAKREKAVFVQIEPTQEIEIWDGFKKSEYKAFIEKHTAIIDLRETEESILLHMKPKGRYNIRIGEKSGVHVTKELSSEENISLFYSLLSETTKRDSFHINSRSYFKELLTYLEREKLGGLYFAKRENEVIAAWIFVFFEKTALYYYGASTSDNAKRKYMAAYILQWELIKEAKSRGCTTYDFLGIAAPWDTTSHLVWVTDFKLKLTDNIWKLPASQIYVVNAFKYILLWLKKNIKKYSSK